MHLTVADQRKYSSVTSPMRVLGIGFSYSQHSKMCQLSIWIAGFYYLKTLQENSRLSLASPVAHVNLMNGHQCLNCSASVFYRTDLGSRLLRRFCYRRLKEIGKGFLSLNACLLAKRRERLLLSYENCPQISKVSEHRPHPCYEFQKHDARLLVNRL